MLELLLKKTVKVALQKAIESQDASQIMEANDKHSVRLKKKKLELR